MNPYDIIYEDDDLLVANKIAPLPVQKDKSGDEDLQSMILRERNGSLGFLEAAHRIDRRTSGIVVFAKNLAAIRALIWPPNALSTAPVAPPGVVTP